jgi:hypothetical protein
VTTRSWKSALAARVLVLGTFHFASPGLDLVNVATPDVLTAEKQAEIAEVLNCLLAFAPHKVVVESRLSNARMVDEQYRRFLSGQELTDISPRNEVVQLGFAMAKRLGHGQVYPIDVPGPMEFQPVLEYAAVHHPQVYQRVLQDLQQIQSTLQRLQQECTLRDALRQLNEPDAIDWGHDMYLNVTQIGAGDNYLGARLIAGWYQRNLCIFSNLQHLLQAGDRVLLIYGSGHAAILRQLIAGYRDTELVDVRDYL